VARPVATACFGVFWSMRFGFERIPLAGLSCLGTTLTPTTDAAGAGLHFAAPAGVVVAQTEVESISSDEIRKYVAVYKAMQQNRHLTVEQAAGAHPESFPRS